MPEIPTQTPAPEPLKTIAERVHMPLLLFSASLFALLFVSWALLLPRFTYLHIGEEKLSPREVVSYEKNMRGQLLTMEEERERLVLPILDETYDALKHAKREALTVPAVRSVLAQAAMQGGLTDGQLHLSALTLDVATGNVTAAGDIRNAGLSSMTLLAAFVEKLEQNPDVTDLRRPSFGRNDHPAIGPHSPFEISFILGT